MMNGFSHCFFFKDHPIKEISNWTICGDISRGHPKCRFRRGIPPKKKNTSIVISPDIRGPEMMVSSTVVLVM